MVMKLKRIIAGISAVAMALSAMSFSAFTTVAEEPANDVFDTTNQKQITEAMEPGWNLGNQLEAVNGKTPEETAWGNPVITGQIFKTVKEAGFKSVRIPVSYLSKIGPAPDYTIETAWLDRIQEVVDMALAEGLYVIINMHGDGYTSMVDNGAWLLCNAPDSEQPAIKAKYEASWRQIAEKFKTYDEHLIFESMNEEFDGVYVYDNGEEYPNRAYYANINAYNQIFVDTVRKTGVEEGNNAKRWLLIPGWNTDINYTTGDYGFELPTDTNRDASIPADEQRIMISVHYYNPWGFAGQGTPTEQGYTNEWGTDAEIQSMHDIFTRCYASFVMKGYPVVIGECGAINKSNESYRVKFMSELCKAARSRGMIPVVWDNNGHGVGNDKFGLINRETFEITQPKIIAAIMDAYKGEAEPAPEIIPPISKDEALAQVKFKVKTLVVSGIADGEINGAAKVRYVFDSASNVAFNTYTTIQLSSNVAGTKTSADVKGYSDLTGVTGCEVTLDLKNQIKTNDAYYIYMYTGSWSEATDYVFLVRRVEFLDASGNIIKTIDKSNKPTPAPALTEPTQAKPTTASPTQPISGQKPITNVKKATIKKLKVNSKKKKITVTWGKLKGAKGYQVQVSANKKFKKLIVNKKSIKKNKITIKHKKIKKGKTYYVRVRAFSTYKNAKGVTKKLYSDWKNSSKVKVK